MSNYNTEIEVVNKNIFKLCEESQLEKEAGRERYRKVSFPFCVYNGVSTRQIPFNDDYLVKALRRVLVHYIIILIAVGDSRLHTGTTHDIAWKICINTLSLPLWKNSGVNCAVFWRKRGKALHYFNTLAKDRKILNLDWWFYDL